MNALITIDRVRAYALRCAVEHGPASSLGAMPRRNGVLLEITDRDGAIGWGEAWCNFPPDGNIAKIALFRDILGPALVGMSFQSWSEARPQLEDMFARMVLHTGEPGPFSHCFAAVDMALADVAARRRDVPVSRLLSVSPCDRIPVYASTPKIEVLELALDRLHDAGHNAVKLKIGYGQEADKNILARFASANVGRMALMVDANQSWTVETGTRALDTLSQWAPEFVEEPLRADAPISEWKALAQTSPLQLAAGENILCARTFAAHVEAGSLQVIQPDLAKWGGLSGAFAAGRHALTNGAVCAMHYMGTGLGLAASIHALAAIGGPGRVEMDANDNPLRTDLGDIDLTVCHGTVGIPTGPGLGFVPAPESLRQFSIAECDVRL